MLDNDRSRQAYLRRTALLLALPLMLTLCAPIANAGAAVDETESTPEAVWSDDYINHIFPWADSDDRILQFKEYHTYDTVKERLQRLAEDHPDLFEFHEGMNGGTNARGEQTTADVYEGWY